MIRITMNQNGEGRLAPGVALAVGLLLGMGASAASAVTVHPLFFEGPNGFGFSPTALEGIEPSASATPGDPWVLAGARPLLTGPGLVVVNRLSAIHENPQGQGRAPSSADPFIVDSTWTVSNETGARTGPGYLVLTKIDIEGRYPGLLAGLDGDLLEIVEYSTGSAGFFFGAMALPSLGVGQSVDLTVRYVVAGVLDYDAESNSFVLPRLGIAGLLVPEPGPLAAIALGLFALAGARARRGQR